MSDHPTASQGGADRAEEAEIRALLALDGQATPAPWESGQHPAMTQGRIVAPIHFGRRTRKLDEQEGGHCLMLVHEDADLIAAARNLAPKLAREVLEFRAEREAQAAELERLYADREAQRAKVAQLQSERKHLEGMFAFFGVSPFLGVSPSDGLVQALDCLFSERATQAAELERLRKAAREVARTYQQLDVSGDAALVLEAEMAGVELLKVLGDKLQPRRTPMPDQPKTPQENADRAEKLRGLSLTDLLWEIADASEYANSPAKDGHTFTRLLEELTGEWDRRCAEREAQEAELEGLRTWKQTAICHLGSFQRKPGESWTQLLQRLADTCTANEGRRIAAEAELERLREINAEHEKAADLTRRKFGVKCLSDVPDERDVEIRELKAGLERLRTENEAMRFAINGGTAINDTPRLLDALAMVMDDKMSPGPPAASWIVRQRAAMLRDALQSKPKKAKKDQDETRD